MMARAELKPCVSRVCDMCDLTGARAVVNFPGPGEVTFDPEAPDHDLDDMCDLPLPGDGGVVGGLGLGHMGAGGAMGGAGDVQGVAGGARGVPLAGGAGDAG